MTLRFVTGNAGKLREARQRLQRAGIHVVGARAAATEIQSERLEAVARAKAESLRGRVRPPFFVEDAGLFVDALRGFPGVYSAHAYAALGCAGLLRLLGRRRDRGARFRAVIALVEGRGPPRLFRGEARGALTHRPLGRGGFGFDPIFRPAGSRLTFAQMAPHEKGAASHRGRALDRLAAHLAPPGAASVARKG